MDNKTEFEDIKNRILKEAERKDKNNMLIKIGGCKYSVNFVDDLARDADAQGRSCGNALWIEVDSNLPKQNQESTIIHEILEQINYRYNIGLEHHQICLLETSIYQVIKDNWDTLGLLINKE